MADSTQASSETPTQPAVADAVAAIASAVTASQESPPKSKDSETPPAAVAEPAEPAKPAEGTPPAKLAEAAKPPEGVKPAETPIVPEKYEFKAPEGVTFDPASITAMTPVFKELGLPQEKAQKLVDAFAAYEKGLPAAMLARDLEVTMKDPDIGGLNYGRTQGYVNQAITAFTYPEERESLEKAGIANRLDLVRIFERVGRAMSNDTAAHGSPTTATQESFADGFYRKAKKFTA
jgi:hypothetical protein